MRSWNTFTHIELGHYHDFLIKVTFDFQVLRYPTMSENVKVPAIESDVVALVLGQIVVVVVSSVISFCGS